MATCLRLSANNWTVAKLYDEDHPQECVERCMERSAFVAVWHKIATCGLPKTRDEAANGEIPLWEDVQAKVNSQFRAICIEGRAAHQSYVIGDHKLHCEVLPVPRWIGARHPGRRRCIPAIFSPEGGIDKNSQGLQANNGSLLDVGRGGGRRATPVHFIDGG